MKDFSSDFAKFVKKHSKFKEKEYIVHPIVKKIKRFYQLNSKSLDKTSNLLYNLF